MAEKEAEQTVRDRDDGAGRLPPVKEENAIMCRSYPPNCCQYF